MRYFFLPLLLAILAVGPVGAQRLPASALPDSLLLAQPAPDTAAAIRRLFAAKRKRCGYLVGGTVVTTAVVAGILLSAPQPTPSGGGFGILVGGGLDSNAINAAGVCLVGVPVLMAELLLCGGWGRKNEQRAINAYEAHQLPSSVKRRLKAKYFIGVEVPQLTTADHRH
jgi:hypothetical protein